MRVLVIVPDKIKKPVGGVGVQLAEITKRLPQIEWDIIGQPEEGNTNYTGVQNPFVTNPHSSLVTAVGQIAYFAEAVKRPKPDIVHAYDWSTYLAGLYTSKHFGVPLVVTMQLSINLLEKSGIVYTADIQNQDGYWLHRLHCDTELSVMGYADAVIQVSNAYASQFVDADNSNKTVVIPNGIDLKDFENVEKVELPGKGLKVVYIGRFATMKGVQALLETKIPDFVDLIFVGKEEGSDSGLFNLMKSKLGNNVHYIGAKYGKEKYDILHSADAVIMPSIHEPFGIVALEALASKTILLSSFANGMSDFLTDDIAINCGTTPQSIENALYRLKDLKDKEERISKGIEVCKKYTWDRASNETLLLYNKVYGYRN
jgi:glycosyltransferase involved in cell wall biosynthesis